MLLSASAKVVNTVSCTVTMDEMRKMLKHSERIQKFAASQAGAEMAVITLNYQQQRFIRMLWFLRFNHTSPLTTPLSLSSPLPSLCCVCVCRQVTLASKSSLFLLPTTVRYLKHSNFDHGTIFMVPLSPTGCPLRKSHGGRQIYYPS